MSGDAIRALEEAIVLCIEARERLGAYAPSPIRLLLDMLLLELGRELAKAAGLSAP